MHLTPAACSAQDFLKQMVGFLAGGWEDLVGLDVLLYYNRHHQLRQQFWRLLPRIGVCRHRQLRPLTNWKDRAYCERLILKEKQQTDRMSDEECLIWLHCIPDKFKRRYESASRGQICQKMGR